MRRDLLLVVSMLSTVLPGCASLKVDVEAYRGQTPPTPAELAPVVDQVLAKYSPDALANHRERIEELVTEVVAKANKEACDRGQKSCLAEDAFRERLFKPVPGGKDTGLLPIVRRSLEKVEGAKTRARAAALVVEQKLSLSRGPMVDAEGRRALGELRNHLGEVRRLRLEFDEALKQALRGGLSQDPVDSSRLEEEFLAEYRSLPGSQPIASPIAASAAVNGRSVGTPLFDLQVAHLSQDEKDWESFGSSRFTAAGGSSQFVVVREGLLVFHQKSLDFDPTPAAGAGMAVTKLGLKVLSAIYTGGLSSGLGATTANGGAGSTTAGSVPLASDSAIERGKRMLARRDAAANHLLMAISDAWEQSTEIGAGNDQAPVVKKLKSELDFFKGRAARNEAEGSK